MFEISPELSSNSIQVFLCDLHMKDLCCTKLCDSNSSLMYILLSSQLSSSCCKSQLFCTKTFLNLMRNEETGENYVLPNFLSDMYVNVEE